MGHRSCSVSFLNPQGGTIHNVLVIAEVLRFGTCLEVVLREHGYEVTVVESYDEFLEGFEGIARTKFDLVIATNTCLTPPDIHRMIPDLKAQHPHARIMVLSGYCPDDFVSELKEQGIDGFICLPFEENVLIQKVAGLMADKPMNGELG